MNMTIRTKKRHKIWRDGYTGWEHYPYGQNPPSWWRVRADLEEEKKALKEYNKMLEDEFNITKRDLKKLEKIHLN